MGGRTDTAYRVRCDACSLGLVQYHPNTVRHRLTSPFDVSIHPFVVLQETFNETRVVISGLNAVTTYRFQIFAENGVSYLQRHLSEYADIVVTTEASVASSITNIRVASVKSTEITLAWDAPTSDAIDMGSDIVETYEVKVKYTNKLACH